MPNENKCCSKCFREGEVVITCGCPCHDNASGSIGIGGDKAFGASRGSSSTKTTNEGLIKNKMKECRHCHKSILRISKWSSTQWMNKKFCSSLCQKRGRDTGKFVPWNKGLRIRPLRKCDECSVSDPKVSFYKKWNKTLCANHYWHYKAYGKALWGDVRPLITPFIKRLRGSKEYADWRMSVFKRDDFTCQDCGERGGKLQADHIMPFSLFPDLRFELSNGRTLCIECHKKTPTYLNPHLKKLYV